MSKSKAVYIAICIIVLILGEILCVALHNVNPKVVGVYPNRKILHWDSIYKNIVITGLDFFYIRLAAVLTSDRTFFYLAYLPYFYKRDLLCLKLAWNIFNCRVFLIFQYIISDNLLVNLVKQSLIKSPEYLYLAQAFLFGCFVRYNVRRNLSVR